MKKKVSPLLESVITPAQMKGIVRTILYAADLQITSGNDELDREIKLDFEWPTRYGSGSNSSTNVAIAASKNIAKEILERNCRNIDADCSKLVNYTFWDGYSAPDSDYGVGIADNVTEIINSIVYFCKQQGLYWDIASHTPMELGEFIKTAFGKEVLRQDCFSGELPASVSHWAGFDVTDPSISATKGASPADSYPAGIRQTSKARPKRTPTPVDKHKFTGPTTVTGKVRDLKSAPGKKEPVPNIMFRIEGVNANSARVTPMAFIRPLFESKNGGTSTGTNRIFVGSCNGYRECALHFTDQAVADAFLVKIQSSHKVKSNITGLHVTKTKASYHGYYKIGTEFGDAYITASKLNEALGEELKQENINLEEASQSIVLDAAEVWAQAKENAPKEDDFTEMLSFEI